MKELTWEQLKQEESGTILHDVFEDGVRFIVMRGPSSLCAYVGIPTEHPLAGFDYDDLVIDAHGGLTFAREGKDAWPKGFYWYGWDYGHSGDKSFYYDDMPQLLSLGDKEWLVKDVVEDSWSAIYDFRQLLKLAEKIRGRE